MNTELTHIDLFSGVGGFAIACRWNGIRTVQFVEIDPFCKKVINKNFPGIPIHDDIKTFHYDGASPFILTGGFPCQPFSCAGKRSGKEDDRFLWPEMLRVVSETKPHWVVGENVAGFINMVLDDCISDLENQGYEVQAFVIPACAVNAPHRRDRVWIVAKQQTNRDRQLHEMVAHPEEPGLQGLQLIKGRTGNETAFTGFECDRWKDPWLEVATSLCRMDDGVSKELYKLETSNRVGRLKALGNSIVPQIAAKIIRCIIKTEVS